MPLGSYVELPATLTATWTPLVTVVELLNQELEKVEADIGEL